MDITLLHSQWSFPRACSRLILAGKQAVKVDSKVSVALPPAPSVREDLSPFPQASRKITLVLVFYIISFS
jgi:hypothetical protein